MDNLSLINKNNSGLITNVRIGATQISFLLCASNPNSKVMEITGFKKNKKRV
jgi:hypothetical protein